MATILTVQIWVPDEVEDFINYLKCFDIPPPETASHEESEGYDLSWGFHDYSIDVFIDGSGEVNLNAWELPSLTPPAHYHETILPMQPLRKKTIELFKGSWDRTV